MALGKIKVVPIEGTARHTVYFNGEDIGAYTRRVTIDIGTDGIPTAYIELVGLVETGDIEVDLEAAKHFKETTGVSDKVRNYRIIS